MGEGQERRGVPTYCSRLRLARGQHSDAPRSASQRGSVVRALERAKRRFSHNPTAGALHAGPPTCPDRPRALVTWPGTCSSVLQLSVTGSTLRRSICLASTKATRVTTLRALLALALLLLLLLVEDRGRGTMQRGARATLVLQRLLVEAESSDGCFERRDAMVGGLGIASAGAVCVCVMLRLMSWAYESMPNVVLWRGRGRGRWYFGNARRAARRATKRGRDPRRRLRRSTTPHAHALPTAASFHRDGTARAPSKLQGSCYGCCAGSEGTQEMKRVPASVVVCDGAQPRNAAAPRDA